MSYRLSYGDNFGIHRRNLLTTIRPLSAPLALWISSSSLFSSMLNWSCMGTSILSSNSSKYEYLFNGMMVLTSFAPPPPLTLSLFACVCKRRTSNPVFVFAVVLLVSSKSQKLFFFLPQICCNHQNIPIDSLQM